MTTLILLGGLPATGKSTIARRLLDHRPLAYLRIDSIEQALRDTGEMGAAGVVTAGYVVGYTVARDVLRGGVDALVECVNPIAITRDAWRDVARDAGAHLVEVEVCCSDEAEHARRAAGRTVDIPGLPLPTWDEIRTRDYEPWPGALRIDTAQTSPDEAAARILDAALSPR